ncbi:hypothetical protein C8Q70DRAFT_1040449 [Cubamyces menziesii]|nr:hypothetical protein C8Q70DRAFT_1040449 [Cubamyces menziesii]
MPTWYEGDVLYPDVYPGEVMFRRPKSLTVYMPIQTMVLKRRRPYISLIAEDIAASQIGSIKTRWRCRQG